MDKEKEHAEGVAKIKEILGGKTEVMKNLIIKHGESFFPAFDRKHSFYIWKKWRCLLPDFYVTRHVTRRLGIPKFWSNIRELDFYVKARKK